MFQKRLLAAFLSMALVTMACGITINLPQTKVVTGETVNEEITISDPKTEDAVRLSLAFGAGELTLEPGNGDALLSGMATYNVEDFKPKIDEDGEDVSIEQGNLEVNAIPSFEDDIINKWAFELGDMPLELDIKAGAYTGDFEFGGLSIKRLRIADGAAKVDLRFSDPNPIELDVFEYTTGASSVTLEGLANANIHSMTFRSGAGSYRLDFSGELQQDAEVYIESGISSVVIIVPKGTQAEVVFEGGIANVDYYGDWERDGDKYEQPGSGYLIRVVVKMGAGNLELRNR